MSTWRDREGWAQVMEEILQALDQWLQRGPELPPAGPAAVAPDRFPALGMVDQRLVQLQTILDQAEQQAGETDRDLTAAAEALQQWLGRQKSETPDAPGSA